MKLRGDCVATVLCAFRIDAPCTYFEPGARVCVRPAGWAASPAATTETSPRCRWRSHVPSSADPANAFTRYSVRCMHVSAFMRHQTSHLIGQGRAGLGAPCKKNQSLPLAGLNNPNLASKLITVIVPCGTKQFAELFATHGRSLAVR